MKLKTNPLTLILSPTGTSFGRRKGRCTLIRTVPILFLFLTFCQMSRPDPVFAFGNQFILNETQDAASLDTMSKKDSLRFTAQMYNPLQTCHPIRFKVAT